MRTCQDGHTYDEHGLCFECDAKRPKRGPPKLYPVEKLARFTEAQGETIERLSSALGCSRLEVIRRGVEALEEITSNAGEPEGAEAPLGPDNLKTSTNPATTPIPTEDP